MATFGIDTSLASSSHGTNQASTEGLGYGLPFLLESLLQFLQGQGRSRASLQSALEFVPNMLDGWHIGWICWPWQHVDLFWKRFHHNRTVFLCTPNCLAVAETELPPCNIPTALQRSFFDVLGMVVFSKRKVTTSVMVKTESVWVACDTNFLVHMHFVKRGAGYCVRVNCCQSA